MKVTSTFLPKTLCALLVTSLLGALMVTAADPTAAPPPGRGRAGGGPPGGGPGGPGFRGGLDDKQRELLRDALQNNSDALQKLDVKMRDAQKELSKAILAEKSDENDKVLREKAEAVAKLQVEQTLLRAKVFAVVVPTLTPEQRDQIANSPYFFDMLIRGGYGGGGMRSQAPGQPGAPGTGPQRGPGGRRGAATQ